MRNCMIENYSITEWIAFFFIQNVLECPMEIQDLAQILFFVDCALLLYFGVVYFMSLCVKYQKKKWSFHKEHKKPVR